MRDEILNIMHRNNIGEKRGTWMEDWHQKLHNNTTPDGVAICEAFIAFLKSEGDRGAYWSVLSDAGRCPLQHMSTDCDLSVPRERLLHQQGVWQGFGLKCMPLAGMAHVCMDSQRLMDPVSASEPPFLCRNLYCVAAPPHLGLHLQASHVSAWRALTGRSRWSRRTTPTSGTP